MPTHYISLHDLNNSDDWKRQVNETNEPQRRTLSQVTAERAQREAEEPSDSDPETGIQYGDLT